MFIVYDGTIGTIRFFENDTEKQFINLGKDFVGFDCFLSVCFGSKNNSVEIVNNHPEIGVTINQFEEEKLEIRKICGLLDLNDQDAILLIEEI